MGFGGKYSKLPTPGRVTTWAKIIQRLIGIGVGVVALQPETLTTKTINVILAGMIFISRDIEDGFGVQVHGPVPVDKVEVLKDTAKIVIFIALIQSYLFLNQ